MTSLVPENILREQRMLADKRQLQSGEDGVFRIWQDYASPYSHKVMTYMNYKDIPYKRMQITMDVYMNEIVKLVGQSTIPVILTPDNQVMQDSTPIMEWFETQYTHKPAIPEDPRLAFCMWLLEEFADEYMPRLHMHTRWGNEQNRQTMSHRIARGLTFGNASQDPKNLAPFLLGRQSGFDQHLGLAGEAVRNNVDQQILDLLAILEEHFKHHQFLLGFKPSLADFSLYGPLRIHLFNDPNSNEIMELNGPRTCRWMDTIFELGDNRGCVGQTEFGDWIDLNQGLPETLTKLLAFVGKTYIPFAKAGVEARKEKIKNFEVEVYGEVASFSSHVYRDWSFEQIQLRYQALGAKDKAFMDEVLISVSVLPALMSDEILHNGLFDGFTPPFVKDGNCDARVKHKKEKAAKKVKSV